MDCVILEINKLCTYIIYRIFSLCVLTSHCVMPRCVSYAFCISSYVSVTYIYLLISSNSMNQTLEEVTVNFHAVVSYEFGLKEKDIVTIRLGNKWPGEGGLDCKKQVLTRDRFVSRNTD